jgi:hypothetical protein
MGGSYGRFECTAWMRIIIIVDPSSCVDTDKSRTYSTASSSHLCLVVLPNALS